MNKISFDRIPRNYNKDIVNIKWKYSQTTLGKQDVNFTIFFELENRLFRIRADKINLIELLINSNIVGLFQEIQVDVSGCFLRNGQPLLWSEVF